MDGHFVPNLTIGLPVVESLLAATDIPMDCHLMIDNPDRWAPPYAEAGAYNVTFHAEATDNPVGVARDIRAAGAKAGISVKPKTPLDPYLEILRHFDTFLVMSVEPGFGGQSFIPEVLGKVRTVRKMVDCGGVDHPGRDRRRHQRGHDRAGRRSRCRLLRRRIGGVRRGRPRGRGRGIAPTGRRRVSRICAHEPVGAEQVKSIDEAMRLAIDLSYQVKGTTYPNPPVGAVIVDHRRPGRRRRRHPARRRRPRRGDGAAPGRRPGGRRHRGGHPRAVQPLRQDPAVRERPDRGQGGHGDLCRHRSERRSRAAAPAG